MDWELSFLFSVVCNICLLHPIKYSVPGALHDFILGASYTPYTMSARSCFPVLRKEPSTP